MERGTKDFRVIERVIIQGMISGSFYSGGRNSLTLRHAAPNAE